MEEDRSWAIGLTQSMFNIEFMRRRPFSDVIPDVMEWTRNQTAYVSREIKPVLPEMIVNDDAPIIPSVEEPALPADAPMPNGAVARRQSIFTCEFCAKEIKSEIGYKSHLRFCKKRPK